MCAFILPCTGGGGQMNCFNVHNCVLVFSSFLLCTSFLCCLTHGGQEINDVAVRM